MKITINIDENKKEDEIIIKCKELNKDIEEIQNIISKTLSKREQIIFYKDNTEYYLSLDKVLFFETESNSIYGHVEADMYEIKHRLYELEEILPIEFVRISKSTILNVRHIRSIDRNILSSSMVEFHSSHKKTYVSRHYYKDFKRRLMEVRGYYEK